MNTLDAEVTKPLRAWTLVIAAILLLRFHTAERSMSAEPPKVVEHPTMDTKPSPPPRETVPAIIAPKVRARLGESPFLKITARVRYKDRTSTVVSIMSPKKLRTAVFEGGRCIAALSAMGRRAQEFVPKATLGGEETLNLLVEYELPIEADPGAVCHPRLIDDALACEVGVFTETWFGTEASPVWFEGTIAASRFKGVTARGTRTLLKYEQVVELPTKTVTHTLLIDGDTMDIAQWDTAFVRTGTTERVERSREYLRFEHAATDQDWKWKIAVQDLEIEAQEAARWTSPKQ